MDMANPGLPCWFAMSVESALMIGSSFEDFSADIAYRLESALAT